MSAILHGHDPRLPDLVARERRGELLFVPVGGGDLRLWATRFARLGCAEFHVYDGEGAAERQLRQEVADVVNLRPRCRAVITRKRAMEDYLHPAAIREASGIELSFTDDDPVADLLAAHRYQQQGGALPWDELESRVRKRRRNRVKKWLHTSAVDWMTPERLAESDPDGEVISWLQTIARLAEGQR
ncbi:MAG: ATP-dependent endonuclease [Planctomycetes bacterium]|nr:ATP-dependent endonuclease [Planctomycetota bacterium]